MQPLKGIFGVAVSSPFQATEVSKMMPDCITGGATIRGKESNPHQLVYGHETIDLFDVTLPASKGIIHPSDHLIPLPHYYFA